MTQAHEAEKNISARYGETMLRARRQASSPNYRPVTQFTCIDYSREYLRCLIRTATTIIPTATKLLGTRVCPLLASKTQPKPLTRYAE